MTRPTTTMLPEAKGVKDPNIDPMAVGYKTADSFADVEISNKGLKLHEDSEYKAFLRKVEFDQVLEYYDPGDMQVDLQMKLRDLAILQGKRKIDRDSNYLKDAYEKDTKGKVQMREVVIRIAKTGLSIAKMRLKQDKFKLDHIEKRAETESTLRKEFREWKLAGRPENWALPP